MYGSQNLKPLSFSVFYIYKQFCIPEQSTNQVKIEQISYFYKINFL